MLELNCQSSVWPPEFCRAVAVVFVVSFNSREGPFRKAFAVDPARVTSRSAVAVDALDGDVRVTGVRNDSRELVNDVTAVPRIAIASVPDAAL